MDISFLGDTAIKRLCELMRILRDPQEGCPWDREQSYLTITPYTIEEAYEVADAIERGDMNDLKEELGDLLFQVIFYTQISREDNLFDFNDVADSVTKKMVRRHPHIFGDEAQRANAEAQTKSWETIKAEERAVKGRGTPSSLLDNVPINLPSLTRAEKLQKRTARVGFDWPNLDGVIDKIKEEADELKLAIDTGIQNDIEDEMGDLLFAIANLSRKLDIDPETALRRTNNKFTSRFQYIEKQAHSLDQDLNEMSLDDMEALWQKAKKQT